MDGLGWYPCCRLKQPATRNSHNLAGKSEYKRPLWRLGREWASKTMKTVTGDVVCMCVG